MFRNVTGRPCPGCGLTRSWVALARGDIAASFRFHRLGWLTMLYAVAQVLRHGLWLVWTSKRRLIERGGHWLDRGVLVIAGLMFVVWLPGFFR